MHLGGMVIAPMDKLRSNNLLGMGPFSAGFPERWDQGRERRIHALVLILNFLMLTQL